MAIPKLQLDALHGLYQGNVYPGMLHDLAQSLGVSAESLDRLDLGWAPIVKFKKGYNYQGWWVVPERDSTGTVVGLALRSQHDHKVMYPGSKHGLVYPVNPHHRRGVRAYQPGPQNWLRTSDEQPCPLCGKPDGCLIAAEDPDNPPAVICRCIDEGAEKPMRWGWLHILRDEGRVRASASLLPESDKPVVIVEGMTDAAAALDLGFVAVGRPSNLSCMDTLREVVRGREVIILGENDKKPDGSHPGYEGMVAAAQMVRDVCSGVRKVLPPDHVKDLRQWVNMVGLTADGFLSYVDEHAEPFSEQLVIPDDRHLTIARSYLHERHRLAGRYTLRAFNDVWFQWDGSCYRYAKDLHIMNPLFQWAHDKMVACETPSGETSIRRLKATRRWVGDIVAAMNSEAEVPTNECPCWVNGATGPDPRNLIAFQNGVMDVEAYLDGRPFDEYMYDPTPDLFTMAALPFAFDPTATCPTFRRWTRSSLGDEFDKVRLLQEFAGYAMTCDVSEQKLLWLRGRPASGKSLFINTLRQLVGDQQFQAVGIKDLTRRFGMAELIGKLVASIPDLRVSRYADMGAALEAVLNITGGDPVPVERKFKDGEGSVQLMCRIVVSSNEMPQFHDPTGAFKRRLLLVEFKRSFVGKEDKSLEKQFTQEIPGIAIWALDGLRRLRAQGGFTIPRSMTDVVNEWHMDNNPVSVFMEECLDYQTGVQIAKKDLYQAFVQWANEHGHFPCSLANFKQRLADRLPGDVRPETYSERGHKFSVYTGMKLVPWAEKQYLGRPLNS